MAERTLKTVTAEWPTALSPCGLTYQPADDGDDVPAPALAASSPALEISAQPQLLSWPQGRCCTQALFLKFPTSTLRAAGARGPRSQACTLSTSKLRDAGLGTVFWKGAI